MDVKIHKDNFLRLNEIKYKTRIPTNLIPETASKIPTWANENNKKRINA